MEKESSRKMLEKAMDKYSNMLTRMAYLVLKDYKLAEDAVQETYINFYYSLEKFREEASVKTYLSSILMNQCRQKLRKTWFRRTLPLEAENTANQGELYMEDVSEGLDLSQGLMKLDMKYRQVLLLHYYSDNTIKEISQMLGYSEGTIKSRLKRGRDKLKELIQEDLFNE